MSDEKLKVNPCTYVIKRDGRRVKFNKEKIVTAILKAFIDTEKMKCDDGTDIPDDPIAIREYFVNHNEYALSKAENIANYVESLSHEKELTIEDIQDYVENGLMSTKRHDVAKSYILYRQQRSEYRNMNTNLKNKYKQVMALITGQDEESNKENSNKDIRIIPTMRDYIAGFTCREIAEGFILPKNILEAHRAGIIHMHDTDYSPTMPMNNCGLINLKDMFENGTVISGVKISDIHSIVKACTVTTQIITQVASSQYGGNTINLAHLAKFVQMTRERYKEKFPTLTDEQIEALTRQDIHDGMKTIQYQLITMSTTNGQAPFTSVFMYLGDAENEQEEKDLALMVEEVLRQRIEGVPNEQGFPITIAFPKLLYVLDENNIYEDSKYYYLTELAARCSNRRLVPDYISAKIMKLLKGDVFGCMGCRSMLSPDPINHRYWGRLTA